jgi:pimeloyl-ACP methyl ester carboxylesterase
MIRTVQISCILLVLLVACKKPVQTLTHNDPINPTITNAQQIIKSNQQVIVLLHGLINTNALKSLEKKLAATFSHLKIIFLNRDNSLALSIPNQAKYTFEQLKNLGLTDQEMILIGDSQGGLVAFELFNTYQKELKLKGIIANHTPWQGTPGTQKIEKAVNEIRKFLEQQLLHFPLAHQEGIKKKIDLLTAHILFQNLHGATDLNPDSPFIKKVAQLLPNISIPILSLSGNVDQFGKAIIDTMHTKLNYQKNILIDNLIANCLTPCKQKWDYFIGEGSPNDLLVPIASQMATQINFDNTLFKTHYITGYHHFSSMSNTPEAYDMIVKSIEAFLNQSTS